MSLHKRYTSDHTRSLPAIVAVGVPSESLTRLRAYVCETCLAEERKTRAFLKDLGLK
jgi:hypothetical protein